MIPVRHIGDDGCNEIAFYFKKRLLVGNVMRSDNCVLLSGEAPEPGTVVVCGHCGKAVPADSAFLRQEIDDDS